jgi:hypothetical protein
MSWPQRSGRGDLDIGRRSAQLFRNDEPAKEPAMSPKAVLAAGIVLGTLSGAMAQGVHQYSFPDNSAPSSYSTSTGGRVHRGTAVPTGRGPLDQPIPPAASSYYSRQLGRATTPTNPSPYPFGTQ